MAPESPSALPDTVPASNGTAALAATEQQGAEAHPSAAPLPLHPPPATGSTIGPYELIRQLGQGGMGTVFLARDTKLGRLVALKLLSTLTGQGARRFLIEARATARCKHENIVVIHDVSQHDGYPYMVLEYLEGQTLRAFLDERRPADAAPDIVTAPLPARRAVELMVPVARALACAHARGIVHRDLKPENIVLEASGPIKVLDFGIAKVREGDASPARTAEGTSRTAGLGLTGEGALLGTLPYMSPEQWGVDDIDHLSDLWAVGIMLYELITGRHPLAPLSMLALAKVADIDTPMPSAADACPALGPLGALIDRCLRKRKAERIASAEELLTELEALLRDPQAAARTEAESPFAGLSAFQEEDAPRFFGRERDITSALGRLRHHALLAVAGPSGAGKSSFVRAGLIPALKRSGEGWEVFILRPGRRPLAALAEICAQRSPDAEDSQALHKTLRDEPGHLGSLLRARCRKAARRALLFVDQFEELYTLGADKDERAAFIACLEGAADDASSPLRLVLSIRSDFLDRMAEERSLMATVTRGLFFLPPLGREELRAALLRPAEAAGHRFETPDMVDAMLDTLEATASPLPLLQFTAGRLWEERDRDRRLLTRHSYDALGGVEGALATHADAVIAALSAREQRLSRAVFLQLVTPERTRAVVSLADLRELDDDGDAIERVVLHLSDARLVQIEHGEERDGTTVELVHESLIERWPRLGRWLGENQEEAAFLAQARTAARQWEAKGRAEGLLWRGQAAEDARRWLARLHAEDEAETGPSRAALGKREERYLRAVVALKQRAQQRRRRLTAAAIVSLAGIALVVSSLAVRARQEAVRAAQQAQRADDEAAHARAEAVQARNATRVAAAREHMDDPTTVLALVREIEPGPMPRGWADLAQWALQSGVARVVLSHRHPALHAAFSPDGKRIVTSSEDKLVRLWSTDGQGEPLILRGHEEPVYSVMFSPDGKRIVTASNDKTARVWNADGSGEPIVLRGHEAWVTAAAFSPDGKRIVTASSDKTARVWNTDGSGEPLILRGHEDQVYSAAFSPDGKRIVTASDDRTARVWNADGSGEPLILQGHEEGLHWAAFSPDGARIVTASRDKTARVWNADGTGRPLALHGHEAWVSSATFSPDGERIITASWDRTARVWNADGTGQPLILQGHEAFVLSAFFSLDGKHIITASWDKTARVWDVNGTGRPLVLRGHKGYVSAAAFSPDGQRIVTASTDKTARVWSADGSGQPLILQGHEHYINAAVFSPDGRRILTASWDRTARVWSADGSGQPLVLRGHDGFVLSAVFSPDGRRIVTASQDKTTRVWNADGSGQPLVLRGHEDQVYAAAFSPDGKRIVTASYDKTALVWNAEGGQLLVLRGHDDRLTAAEFSPDGKRIVTASADKTARVWNADGQGEPLVLRGHEGVLSAAAFSADGARIVTASGDKTIRIWQADGKGEPLILRGAAGFFSAAFSPDGKRIVAASEDKTAWVWSNLEPLRTSSDPRLWAASTYCMPVAQRIHLLDIPEDLARQNQDTCLRFVQEAQGGVAPGALSP